MPRILDVEETADHH